MILHLAQEKFIDIALRNIETLPGKNKLVVF